MRLAANPVNADLVKKMMAYSNFETSISKRDLIKDLKFNFNNQQDLLKIFKASSSELTLICSLLEPEESEIGNVHSSLNLFCGTLTIALRYSF